MDGNGMNNIRIMLAEDREIVQKGFHGLIEKMPYMEVVGEETDGNGAVQLARKFEPDVVILNVSIPEWEGRKNNQRMHGDFGFSLFQVVCRLLVDVAKYSNVAGVKVTMYRNKHVLNHPAKEVPDSTSTNRPEPESDNVIGFSIFNVRERW
jgi:hypothetical protein